MLRKLSLLVLLISIPLLAQPIPTVNAVTSAAGVVEDTAPGGIATVWGLDFAAAPAQAGVLPLPVTLGETTVTINGIECPLFYVSEFQINLQIPLETPVDIEVEAIVKRGGLSSEPFALIVRTDAISIFTYERVAGAGEFEPVVLHSDGVTLVTLENPAKTNEVLVIYATGFGPLLGGPISGMPAPPGGWITQAKPAAIYSTNQAGYGLTVEYSGLAAGFVGLWQLNIKMPPSVPAGENGAMRITLDNSFQSISFPFVP